MRLVSDAAVTSISHDGETHTPLEGCDVFDLPAELGRHLLDFPLLGWREATDDDLPAVEAFDPAPRPEDAGRLTVDEALAELELDDQGDDELDDDGDDEGDDGDPADATPKTPRKRAPRKTAAAPAA